VTRSVLIVDDHPAFRASARRLLERAGYAVVAEAADGAQALRAAAEARPEIVLLDVQLPDTDGFAVAAQLAGPAVILTSSRDAADFDGLVQSCGARGFIRKDALTAAAIAELVG
jgi:DNA-binding NarL/FixJ family response regulator